MGPLPSLRRAGPVWSVLRGVRKNVRGVRERSRGALLTLLTPFLAPLTPGQTGLAWPKGGKGPIPALGRGPGGRARLNGPGGWGGTGRSGPSEGGSADRPT